MNEVEAFVILYSKVKLRGNFVPRDYQTIGGMWTVDTYRLGNVLAQSMDEGYTDKLLSDKVVVYRYSNGKMEYTKGTAQDLIDLVGELNEINKKSV